MKKTLVAMLLISTSLLTFGCSKQDGQDVSQSKQASQNIGQSKQDEPLTEYANKLNTFSISVPGEWTVAEVGNDDHLVLDNSDQSLSILLQKYPKDLLIENLGIEEFDDFIKFYEEGASIANLKSFGTVTDLQTLDIDSMKNAAFYEFVGENEGIVNKSIIYCLEGNNGMYSLSIAGLGSVYDENIEILKNVVNTLKEIE